MAQQCYICGDELIPVPRRHKGPLADKHATRDHVPPEGLFLDPKPSDLITVPCCYACNRKHSDHDEQFRAITALQDGANDAGQRIAIEKVFGSTMKSGRQPEFILKLAESRKLKILVAPDGSKKIVHSLGIAEEPILSLVKNIVKGLLSCCHPEFNYHNHHFEVLPINPMTLAQGNADEQLQFCRELKTKTQRDGRGNFEEFAFWHQVEKEHEHGVWLLLFYGVSSFVVMHQKTRTHATA